MSAAVKSILNRNLFLYGLCAAFILVICNEEAVLKNINLAVLNRLRPSSFDPMVHGKVENNQWHEYARYYRKISEVLPGRSDAYGLYAYVRFQQGYTDEAFANYKKAQDLNPDFFWYYFNPGLMYFRNHEYGKAQEAFLKAVNTDRNKTFALILSSQRLYLPLILNSSEAPQQAIISVYKSDYGRARKLFQLANFAEQKGVQLNFDSIGIDLELALF